MCGLDGSFVRKFGSEGVSDDQLMWPNYVTVDTKQQLLYVADRGNHRVKVLKLDGRFVRAFGSEGSGDGQFQHAKGVALNAAGEILVSDNNEHRIQVWRCCLSLFDGFVRCSIRTASFCANSAALEKEMGS